MAGDDAQQPVAVLGLRDDVDVGVAQQRHDPLAQQREVLGDHDPHGSSARTVVPRPLGLVTVSAAVERLDAMAQPGQPAAVRVGAAGAAVGDLDDEPVAPSARARTRAGAPPPCLAALVSASAATKYAAVSTTGGGRAPISASTVTGMAERRPSASSAAARPRSASTGGAIPRARSRSSAIAEPASSRALAHQLGHLGLVVEARLRAAEVHAERDEPRLRAVVQVALDPAQLGGLDVDRAAARAGQLVDALLQLLLARGALAHDEPRAPPAPGQPEQGPDGPERAGRR